MATRRQTVAKIAISIPRDVLKELDRSARKQRITRSRFITRAIIHSLTKYSDEEISRQISLVVANKKARMDPHEWDTDYRRWLKERS